MAINWGTGKQSLGGRLKSLAGTVVIPATIALAPSLAKAIGFDVDTQTLEGQLSAAAFALAGGTASTAAALQQNVKANDLVEQRRADQSEADRLANNDIAKAIGKAIATIIALHAGTQSKDSPWKSIADDYERIWTSLAESAPPESLGMLHDAAILDAIKSSPDAPAFSTASDKAFWQNILALMAEQAGVDGTTLAACPEYPTVVDALDTRFRLELYSVLKQDAANGGRAYPGIMLCGMGRTLFYLERLDKRQADDGQRLDRITRLLHDVINKLAANSPPPYSAFARLLAKIEDAHAPNLTLPAKSTDPTRDRFVYRTERINLFGREQELLELNTWFDKPDPFGWDLWVGPAGSGKSRLALHLCKYRANSARADGGWYAGFFQYGVTDLNNWRQWTPRQHTLIVFDYVAEKAELIGQIIDLLTQRAVPAKDRPLPQGMQPWPQGIKVRCLLLERAALKQPDAPDEPAPAKTDASSEPTKLEAPWLATLRAAAKQSGAAVETVYARGDIQSQGRYIGGVSAVDAREIIAQEAANAGAMSTPAELIGRYACAIRIDAALRPLFVAMAAEAHRERHDVADFDQLVQHIQEKEWKHALDRLRSHPSGPGASDEAWEKLVCLATMCEGLQAKSLSNALKPSAGLDLPTVTHWSDGRRYDMLISGADRSFAPKLEPDIVGEAFVLRWLREHPMEAEDLIARAWELGMDGFVARCAQNFPEETETSGLLAPTPQARPAALVAAHAVLALQDSRLYGKAVQAARGQKLLLDTNQPAFVRAVGAYLWQQVALSPEETDSWSAACQGLQESAETEMVVAKPLAYALVNAIARDRDIDTRSPVWLQCLETLSNCHPDAVVLRQQLALGLYNAYNNAAADGPRAKLLLARLVDMLDLTVYEPEVTGVVGTGLANAIARAVADNPAVPRWLVHLRRMHRSFPFVDLFALNWARGLYNAFNVYPSDSNAARRLRVRLLELAYSNPDVAHFRQFAARASFNAFHDAIGKSEDAGSYLDDLNQLATTLPGDATVRDEFSKALLHAFYESRSNAERAEHLADAILRLADENPADTTANLRACKACFLLFGDASEEGVVLPAILYAIARLLPRLARERASETDTRNLIDRVTAIMADIDEPAKGVLEKARAALQHAYQTTFDKPPAQGRDSRATDPRF